MIAYRVGPSWRSAVWIAIAIGVFVYGVAFVIAFTIDQPFGPILVLTLAGIVVLESLILLGFPRRDVIGQASHP
jgi:ABC-type Mn2+/Zn2+ transport system permease subunit